VKIATGLLAGFLAGRLVWLMARPLLRQPAFLRSNYRGRIVPTGGGVVLALTVLVVEAGRVLAGAAGSGAGAVPAAPRAAALVAATGFALMGLLDDLAGAGDPRGFRGHVSALYHGRLTSGGVKLLGGGAVALLAAALARPAHQHGAGGLVASAAVVALAGNLANLLDRAPGRALKAGLVAFVALVASASGSVPAGVAVAAGAGLALLRDDLRERLMLGDTGANALGAVIGVGVVAGCGFPSQMWVLAALLAANLASEVVSFTRVIEAIPPLRAIDRAGRRR
jgi:UDP-N-acetylmuramyl pentapeptide phosphotransferase/UDP-N-acetylglucosamine-1-phosphate transferase